MKELFKSSSLITLLLSVICISIISAQNLETQLDKLYAERYKKDTPGATILVAKEGKIIYHKAFGLANMELSVSMNPNNVFEIGSMTKQFTAVSILMLLEQGKLNIDDEITKFIPGYPTHGKKITIHHLLNHTSGIKSYTSMNLTEIARKDMTPTEIIDYFKNEPMDFDPGEEWRYNNSGYILLGDIIEKVSGKSYEDFVEQNIFKPLGMDNSYYGHKNEIIKNRASGYQTRDGFVNASYLSMSLPYAAGSLMSTVEDLYKWQKGLNSNALIKKETLQKAFQNTKLNNGKPTYYGYGWSINEINGSPSLEHGGGIFGYTSYGVYIPEKDTYVATLTNCNCNSPTDITIEAASIAINKPYTSKIVSKISLDKLEKLVGVYEFEDKAIRFITLEGDQLYSKRDGGGKFKIFPRDENNFFFEDSFSEIEFVVRGKKVEAIFKDRIKITKGNKTEKPLPAKKVEISLSENILSQYTGTYEIQPGFDLEVRLEKGKLVAQATGQSSFPILAETETKFFNEQFGIAIEFKPTNGKVSNAVLYQGGQETLLKRKD